MKIQQQFEEAIVKKRKAKEHLVALARDPPKKSIKADEVC